MLIRVPKPWEGKHLEATPEHVYLNRRQFVGAVGAASIASMFGPSALSRGTDIDAEAVKKGLAAPGETWPDFGEIYPAKRNDAFRVEADRPVTDEFVAASYNNYYEFTTRKDQVKERVSRFRPWPWTVEVTGLVHKPQTIDVETLVRTLPLEERLYRFRCVEAWAMVVPWTGFPLHALLKKVEPKASAKYVRFVSFLRPEQAPGQAEQDWYSWPYYEGLTIDEAMNDLTLIATGIYGHALPKQHGAPLRLVVPWKYGFKGLKAIARIELCEEQPKTFWNDLQPNEYKFAANVEPDVPHPRWSQATERLIPGNERRATLLYNGYGEQVAGLYSESKK